MEDLKENAGFFFKKNGDFTSMESLGRCEK
jgi:hypothetical protein